MQPNHRPSMLPTSQPSVVPSLSRVRTYLNISKIEGIPITDVTQNKTSIRVLVTLSQKADVFINCGAFPMINGETTFPTSIEEIFQQYFRVFSTDIFAVVDLTSLTPSTLYDVYCVSTSLQGISSPFGKAFIRLSTGCCKTITIDGSILTNQYSKSIVNSAITVIISALPSLPLSMSLFMQNLQNSSDRSMTIIPSTYDVLPGSISKRFISAAVTGKSGLYRLGAVLNGDSAMEYQLVISNGANIRILDTNQIPAAPILMQAQMCQDGTCVLLSFDSATNRGRLSSSFPCSTVLRFPGASMTTCKWLSDQSIALATQSNSLNISSVVSILKNSSITAKCLVNMNCSQLGQLQPQNITILAPSVPLVPQVIIVAPLVIDNCSTLVLDASNSYGFGGRLWKSVIMTVADSQSRQSKKLQSFLNENYSVYSVTPIPRYLLSAGHVYTFSLTLCNFLGYCSTDAHVVEVVNHGSSNGQLPIVSIPGGKFINMVTAEVLTLRAVATTHLCDGTQSSEYLSYSWSLSIANGTALTNLESSSVDASLFKLPAYSLMTGNNYMVTVNVTYASTGLSSYSSVFVTVLKSDLIAVLQGNPQKYLSSGSNLTLDASQSRDSDVYRLQGVAAGLSYSWSCVQIFPIFENTCPVKIKFSQKDRSKSEKLLITSKNIASVTVRVTVTVFDATRSNSVFNDVIVQSTVTTSISVEAGSLSYPYYVSVNSSLQLTGLVTSSMPCSASWTWDYPDTALNSVSLTPLAVNINAQSIFQSTFLILKANMLPPNTALRFSLSCGTAVNYLEVETNGGPSSGSFSITPPFGEEMITNFLFSALLWVDKDLPLQYQFGYKSALTDANIALSGLTAQTYTTSALPVGPSDSDYVLPGTLIVQDCYGASTSTATTAVVYPLNSTTVMNILRANSARLPFTGTLESHMIINLGVGSSLLSFVDCSAAPSCSTLNRNICRLTAQTCGSCFDGFIGDVGDHNSPCVTRSSYLNSEMLLLSSRILFCRRDSDCPSIWYSCTQTIQGVNSTCQLKAKGLTSRQCSNNGVPMLMDSRTGALKTFCLANDLTCVAFCKCRVEYTGAACEKSQNQSIAIHPIVSSLIVGLRALTVNEDANDQNTLSWSSTLSVLVGSNAYSLNSTDLQMVDAIVQSIFHSAKNLNLLVGERYSHNDLIMQNLLKSIDTLASISLSYNCSGHSSSRTLAYSDFCRSNSSVQMLSNMVSSVMDYADLLARYFFPGMNTSVSAYENFVLLVASNAALNANNISMPSSTTSLSFLSPYDNASITTALLETYPKSYTNKDLFSTNPLMLKVYPSASDSDTRPAVASTNIQFIDNTDIFQYAKKFVPQKYVTSCLMVGDFSVYNYTCQGSNYVINRRCRGEPGSFVDYCPVQIPTCNAVNSSTGVITSPTNCHAISYSPQSTTCQCGPDTHVTRRSLLTSPSSQSAIYTTNSLDSLFTSFKYVPYSVAGTFSVARSGGSTPQNSYFILIGTHSVLWGFALLLLLWGVVIYPPYANKGAKKRSKVRGVENQDGEVITTDLRGSTHLFNAQDSVSSIHGSVMQYINHFFPSAYAAELSIIDRIILEIRKNHRYCKMFLLMADNSNLYWTFPMTVCKALSVLTMNMFVLLVLFQIQYPLTTSTCAESNTQIACEAEKAIFIESISRCQWSTFTSSSDNLMYYQCEDSTASYSHKAMIYMIFLSIVISAIPIAFIDILFRAVEAPLLSSKENQVSPSSGTNGVGGATVDLPNSQSTPQSKIYLKANTARHQPDALNSSRNYVIRYFQEMFQLKHQLWKKDIQKSSNSRSIVDKSNNLLELEYNQILTDNDGGSKDFQRSLSSEQPHKMSTPFSKLRIISRHTETVVPVRQIPYDVEVRSPASVSSQSTLGTVVNSNSLAMDILRQRQLLIDQQNDSISQAELQLVQTAVTAFDIAWGIAAEPNSSFQRRKVNVDSPGENLKELSPKTQQIIVEELANVRQQVLNLKAKLKYSSESEIGQEIMYSFIMDLLGHSSVDGKLYAQKFDMIFTQRKFISSARQRLAGFLLVSFNVGVFIYLLFLCYRASFRWQAYYIVSVSILLALELIIISTLECIWVNFAIADMSRGAVLQAYRKISTSIMSVLVSNEAANSESMSERAQRKVFVPCVLNAPDFLFVSSKLAEEYPNSIESLIISCFRSHVPAHNLTEHFEKLVAAQEMQRRRKDNQLYIVALFFGIKAVCWSSFTGWTRRLRKLLWDVPSDVTNTNIYFLTSFCYMLMSSFAANVGWQLQSPLLRMVISGVFISLTTGWYACNSELQKGFFIGAITVLFLFFLFVLFDQYRFYNRRFKTADREKAAAHSLLDLTALSLQLMNIRRLMYLQQGIDITTSPEGDGGEHRFRDDNSAMMLEESKSIASLNSLAKSLNGSAISRASSKGSNNNKAAEGDVSIMIRDMSNEYIVDSSSLSGVFLPSALSGDNFSDEEDDSVHVEIVDHVSDSDSARNR